eukprot:8352994-Pyramimonas_sp.AAC.1
MTIPPHLLVIVLLILEAHATLLMRLGAPCFPRAGSRPSPPPRASPSGPLERRGGMGRMRRGTRRIRAF